MREQEETRRGAPTQGRYAGDRSQGVGLHDSEAGEPMVTVLAVPSDLTLPSTRCRVSALTNTGVNPVNPISGLWDANGSADMVTLIEGTLVDVGKDDKKNPNGVWIFKPFL